VQLFGDVDHGYGLVERVDANIPVVGGGEVLGYELLEFEGTKFHSWLCHNARQMLTNNWEYVRAKLALLIRSTMLFV